MVRISPRISSTRSPTPEARSSGPVIPTFGGVGGMGIEELEDMAFPPDSRKAAGE